MVLSSKTQGLNLSVPCSIKALPFCRFPLCNCVVCVWFFSRRGSRVAPEIPESRWVKGLWNLVVSSSHNRDSRECFGIWNLVSKAALDLSINKAAIWLARYKTWRPSKFSRRVHFILKSGVKLSTFVTYRFKSTCYIWLFAFALLVFIFRDQEDQL